MPGSGEGLQGALDGYAKFLGLGAGQATSGSGATGAGLGRDARLAQFLVELVKQGRESLERGIAPALDGAQGMAGRHAVVEVQDGQKFPLGLPRTPS